MAEALILRWSGDHDWLHRVRNFGEDVWGELNRTSLGEASLEEIDSSIDQFKVTASKRNVGVVTDLLKRLLKRHNLADQVKIERA